MATPWDDVRRDFPGLEGKAYLNAAAASPTPRPVREAVDRFQREMEDGGDRDWDEWLERREGVRR
ncbi:MAG TPA: aminotransferase, partial [Vicinamibacteria bacterium]